MARMDWDKARRREKFAGAYVGTRKRKRIARAKVQVSWPGSDKVYTFGSVNAVARKLGVSSADVRQVLRSARERVASGKLRGFSIRWRIGK